MNLHTRLALMAVLAMAAALALGAAAGRQRGRGTTAPTGATGTSGTTGQTGATAIGSPAVTGATGATGGTGAVVPASEYGFSSGAGMLFFYVKREKATDFEAVVSHMQDALRKSTNAIRRQQTAGWKVYKSAEPAVAGTPLVYIWVIDPAVAKSDYNPITLFEENFPNEMQSLFTRLDDDIVKVERMGLTLLKDMGANR